MIERCEKCARPRPPRGYVLDSTHCHATGSDACVTVVAAYRRGLREGAELARDRATPRLAYSDEPGWYGSDPYPQIDWSDVDAELERRTKS